MWLGYETLRHRRSRIVITHFPESDELNFLGVRMEVLQSAETCEKGGLKFEKKMSDQHHKQ